MAATRLWKPGDRTVLRHVVNGRTWNVHSVIVVKDTLAETALLELPGAQCAYPEGHFRWKHGDYSQGTRWHAAKSGDWTLRLSAWHTNRLLMLMEPDTYYATCYIWHHKTDEFQSYYVNFQLPYRRTDWGFDTLDLDLDLVVDPAFIWHWKDEDVYREAIREGVIQQTWIDGVAQAQDEVLVRIQKRHYPFDGSWLQWRPDAAWQPSPLPDGWQFI